MDIPYRLHVDNTLKNRIRFPSSSGAAICGEEGRMLSSIGRRSPKDGRLPFTVQIR